MLMTRRFTSAILITIAFTLACSTRDTANGSVARDTAAAPPSEGASGGSTRAGTAADSIVRGSLTSVSDSALTLSTPGGSVRVAVAPPIKVYVRQPGDLSRVTDHSFVGVTTVSEP